MAVMDGCEGGNKTWVLEERGCIYIQRKSGRRRRVQQMRLCH